MAEITQCNAVITRATLRVGRHGLQFSIGLNTDRGDLAFGSYSLYSPDKAEEETVRDYAGSFLWRVLSVSGASAWGELIRKNVRIRTSRNDVIAIGHIIEDRWFTPREEYRREPADA